MKCLDDKIPLYVKMNIQMLVMGAREWILFLKQSKNT